MIREYFKGSDEGNYEEAQRRIKEAMEKGENYVFLPKTPGEFNWVATSETIERLMNDGFDIDKVWQPWEYYSVEWYEN